MLRGKSYTYRQRPAATVRQLLGVLTGNILHHEEQLAVHFTHLVKTDDVWMIELLQNLCFAQKAVNLFDAQLDVRLNRLDRYGLSVRFTNGLVDNAHATAGDLLQDLKSRRIEMRRSAL